MADDTSRVWAQDMSLAYAEHLVPATFQPYAEYLAARIAQLNPRHVLELAAGTGVLTQALVARLPEAQITATDLNVAMVEVGAKQVPSANWEQADAGQLTFDDETFDVVACQFGVMFLSDRAAAYAGMGRVLRPGGHLWFTSWGALATHEVEAAVMASLAEIFPDDPPSFLPRVPHGYHDSGQIGADLAAGGLADVHIETVDLTCTGRSAKDLATGYCRGTPLRAEIEARGDLSATTRAVEAALESRFGSASVSAGMSALVVSARRPA